MDKINEILYFASSYSHKPGETDEELVARIINDWRLAQQAKSVTPVSLKKEEWLIIIDSNGQVGYSLPWERPWRSR